MKLMEALQLKGSGVEIPDCTREELPQLFADLGYKVGAEIGVYKGHFTRSFAKAGLKIYGIDIWKPYKEFDRVDDNRIERQEQLYKKASGMLSKYKEVTVIRKMSMDALNDFEDESLDFVYIDANHILKYAIDDIYGWSKKVRKGGIISGHDYVEPSDFGEILNERLGGWYARNIHVKYAVDAYTISHQINNWYILGRKERVPGELRDRCRSWMWLKP